jgi:DNA-binding beta-propeller fold protein YncE
MKVLVIGATGFFGRHLGALTRTMLSISAFVALIVFGACGGGSFGTGLGDASLFEGADVDDGFTLEDMDVEEWLDHNKDFSSIEHDEVMDEGEPLDLDCQKELVADRNEEDQAEMRGEGFEDSENCHLSSDCPQGFYCLASKCVPWECVPGKRWCEEGNVVQCSLTGDSWDVVENCDDGDPCTVGDTCENGRCLAGEMLDCDDNNPCTSDYCSLGECEHSSIQSACDDLDPCTTNDSCTDGACIGEPLMCDDENPCTDDFCDPLVGCKFLPNLASCDDMNPCTINDICRDGVCTGIDASSCDDGDECTRDYCKKETATCEHEPLCKPCIVDEDCDDLDLCTVDTCETGYCRAYPSRLPPCCVQDADCKVNDECATVRCVENRCTYLSLEDPSCCSRDVFFEDFSQGAGGIVTDPPNEGVGWQVILSNRCYSQPNCLYYGNPQTMSFETSSRNFGAVITQPIRLPAQSQITLSLALYIDCEATPSHDVLKISALTEKGRFILWQKPPQMAMGEWNAVTIDISALSGRFVALELFFDTVDETNNNGAGVFVDDIRIVSTCRPKACSIPLDCHFLEYAAECPDEVCDFGSVLTHTFSIGRSNDGGGNLVSPYGVAWAEGRIYVTDDMQGSIFVYALRDGRGEALYSFGAGILKAPHGLRVSGSRVFVADTENNRVAVFTTSGVLVFAFGLGTNSYSPMKQPKDVALTHDGGAVYVADTGNHRVMAFDPDGHFLFEFGEYGRKDGQFRSPSCIAVTSDYKVIVCDTVNQRLQVFTYDGQFISKIAFQGDFALDYPYGVMFIEPSDLWISDTFHHRLIRTTLDGRFLDYFGSYGSTFGAFEYPFSIAGSQENQIFVADANNSRIVVLEKIPLR